MARLSSILAARPIPGRALGLVALLAGAHPAWSQDDPALTFFLDLDTGGHRAVIRGLSASADGKTLASVSDDKTVRVWDLTTGQTVAILRGQIGDGSEGVINAVALSPNGGHAAVGGYFAPHATFDQPFGDIRIFDTHSGRILRVLKRLEFPVEAIAYSAARDELVASGQGGVVARWKAPFGAAEPVELPPLDTWANRVRALDFALDDRRLVVTTLDYGLRLWDLDSGALVEGDPTLAELEDVPLTALAVAPDGRQFAIAGADGRVEVRNATTGVLDHSLPPRPFRPEALAMLPGGAAGIVVVSCGYDCGETHRSEVWDIATQSIMVRHLDHDGAISAALALPQDGAAAPRVVTAGSRSPELLIWQGLTGQTEARLGGIGQPVSAVALTADAARVAWGFGDPCPELPICPDLAAPLDVLHDLPVSVAGFDGAEPRAVGPQDTAGLIRQVLTDGTTRLLSASSPDTAYQGDRLVIEGPAGPSEIGRDGTDGYFHAAFTLLPDAGQLISGGGNGFLMAHDLQGRLVREFAGHSGTVLSVAASESAGRLVSGSADQTMRLWNIATGRTIVSGFAAGSQWIWWTPEGYYHSSPEADAIVGWHVNQGQDREARYIRARQLRRHLHNPAVVRQALLTGDPAAAAQSLMGTSRGLEALLLQQPPEFEVRIDESIPAPSGQVALELTGASAEEIAEWGISILVNNRRVRPEPLLRHDLAGRAVYLVPLEAGQNDIRVASRDTLDAITERGATALMATTPQPKRGKLHVAVIGIDRYADLSDTACGGRSCDLKYAVADAVEFLNVVTDRMAPLYDGLETLVMVSPEALDAAPERAAALRRLIGNQPILTPERDTIIDALEDFLSLPGPDDTTVLFVAGHGTNQDDSYFVLPADARARDSELRRASLVDWRDLQDQIDAAYGLRMLFVDTCHAANAVNPKFRKDTSDGRMIAFTATLAGDVAQEQSLLGHGLFTWAVLEGLRGRADNDGSGVRLLGLTDYVDRQVRRLSKGKQVPVYHLPTTTNLVLTKP